MGKGLAKAFKERDPAMYVAYKSICERNLLEPGKLWLWQGSEGWVLNFPTKKHWRSPSKIEWIEAGLKKFVAEYRERGIEEISFPRLGCGNGGLDWSEVQPLMERYLGDLDITVFIHDYTVDIGLPEHFDEISRQLQSEGIQVVTFESFLSSMRRVVELGANGLIELETKARFSAEMDDAGDLTLKTEKANWVIEREDLRGVWLSLLSGLLTKAQAGWSMSEGGNALLTILSVLPQARVIEIEGPLKTPELAVEFRSLKCRTSPIPIISEQTQFAWV